MGELRELRELPMLLGAVPGVGVASTSLRRCAL